MPSIYPGHSTIPLKSALATLQPILPGIASPNALPRNQPKKRVRFALKLDPEEEKAVTPVDEEKTPTFIVHSAKRVVDPWRTNGPLCGQYTEYLEKKENSTPELLDFNRPGSPVPEPESSTYTHTFLIQSKIPEIVVDSITVSTPSRHLPRIIQRPKATKTTVRKSPSPVAIDPIIKTRATPISPPRRLPHSANSRNPASKRSDPTVPSTKSPTLPPIKSPTLPPIKSPNSNERVIRSDQPLGTKIVNEYLQAKKLTEIISNPLPSPSPHQISYICGHSILPNLSKTPSTSYQNPTTNEPYFFRNHSNDHFQPIIHPSH